MICLSSKMRSLKNQVLEIPSTTAQSHQGSVVNLGYPAQHHKLLPASTTPHRYRSHSHGVSYTAPWMIGICPCLWRIKNRVLGRCGRGAYRLTPRSCAPAPSIPSHPRSVVVSMCLAQLKASTHLSLDAKENERGRGRHRERERDREKER